MRVRANFQYVCSVEGKVSRSGYDRCQRRGPSISTREEGETAIVDQDLRSATGSDFNRASNMYRRLACAQTTTAGGCVGTRSSVSHLVSNSTTGELRKFDRPMVD